MGFDGAGCGFNNCWWIIWAVIIFFLFSCFCGGGGLFGLGEK
ncbi:MAG: hypothetical protein ACM3X9_10885 [Bacillota bacterium]